MVGRRAAYRVLTAWLADRNGMQGAKERNLQQIWQKYQSVAHLWATRHLVGMFPMTSDDLICFISLAEFIRCRAEAHWPDRAREPLLDPRVTWKVPANIPVATVTWDLGGIKLPEKWMHKTIENGDD